MFFVWDDPISNPGQVRKKGVRSGREARSQRKPVASRACLVISVPCIYSSCVWESCLESRSRNVVGCMLFGLLRVLKRSVQSVELEKTSSQSAK